jgi:hypothetical protein
MRLLVDILAEQRNHGLMTDLIGVVGGGNTGWAPMGQIHISSKILAC